MSVPGSTPGVTSGPPSGVSDAPAAGFGVVAGLVPVLVLLVVFARVRATPLRAEGFLSVPEREAVELNDVEFNAAAFEAAALEAAVFEAALIPLPAPAARRLPRAAFRKVGVRARCGNRVPVGEPAAGASADNHGVLPDSDGAIQGARGRCHVSVYDFAL